MSTTPRTPVHFPRMKVRGARRKRLSVFYTRRMVIPYARMTQNGQYGSITLTAIAGYELGAYSIEHTREEDGWGRIRGVPKTIVRPAADPNPEQTIREFFSGRKDL